MSSFHRGPRTVDRDNNNTKQQLDSATVDDNNNTAPCYVSEVSFCGSVPQICAPPSGPKLAAQRVKEHNKSGSSSSSAKQQLLERSHQRSKPELPKLRAAAADPINSRVWTADETGELCLRDGQSGALLLASAPASEQAAGAAANALLWTKNNSSSSVATERNFLWAAFTTGKILIIHPESGTTVHTINTGLDGAMCLTESRCGQYIFVGGVTGGVTAYLSYPPFSKLGTWNDHRQFNPDCLVLSVASSSRTAEFGFIASGGSDGSVLLWEPEEDNQDGGADGDEKKMNLNVVRQFENATLSGESASQESAVLALLCVEVEYETVIEETVPIVTSDENDGTRTPPPEPATATSAASTPTNNNTTRARSPRSAHRSPKSPSTSTTTTTPKTKQPPKHKIIKRICIKC